MDHYDYVNIIDYDQTIACQPFVDQRNASIIYGLLENLGIPPEGKTVLDLGTGTGQVVMLLKGLFKN